jgi:hypothetical protein
MGTLSIGGEILRLSLTSGKRRQALFSTAIGE